MERKFDEKGGNEILGIGGGVCFGWVGGIFFIIMEEKKKIVNF